VAPLAPHDRMGIPLAGRRWNPVFARVLARGRRSGRGIPAAGGRTAGAGRLIILACVWGPVDWHRTSKAAAGGVIRWRARDYEVAARSSSTATRRHPRSIRSAPLPAAGRPSMANPVRDAARRDPMSGGRCGWPEPLGRAPDGSSLLSESQTFVIEGQPGLSREPDGPAMAHELGERIRPAGVAIGQWACLVPCGLVTG